MLDAAFRFIASEVNAYFLKRTGSMLGQVVVGPISDDAGKWVIAPNTLQLTLVQVEQEPTLRNTPPEPVQVGSTLVLKSAPLRLNALVLIAANFANYEQGLRQLSLLLTFMHAHPLFTASENAGLPPPLERLAVDLVSQSPEQLNQLWSMLGAKHLPSVFYRLRMFVLEDADPSGVGPPITTIDATVRQR